MSQLSKRRKDKCVSTSGRDNMGFRSKMIKSEVELDDNLLTTLAAVISDMNILTDRMLLLPLKHWKYMHNTNVNVHCATVAKGT